MTYGKISVFSLAAGAAVALFWSMWLLVAELFLDSGFYSIPRIPGTLELLAKNVVISLVPLPTWLAGLSRAAVDPIAAMLFAAAFLMFIKIGKNFKKHDPAIDVLLNVFIGIIFGFIVASLIGAAAGGIITGGVIGGITIGLISGVVVGVTMIMGVRGRFTVSDGVIGGIGFISFYAALIGVSVGGPIGIIALVAMAVPYMLFGICYLLYRGAREVFANKNSAAT